jgi:hypothetical protein
MSVGAHVMPGASPDRRLALVAETLRLRRFPDTLAGGDPISDPLDVTAAQTEYDMAFEAVKTAMARLTYADTRYWSTNLSNLSRAVDAIEASRASFYAAERDRHDPSDRAALPRSAR